MALVVLLLARFLATPAGAGAGFLSSLVFASFGGFVGEELGVMYRVFLADGWLGLNDDLSWYVLLLEPSRSLFVVVRAVEEALLGKSLLNISSWNLAVCFAACNFSWILIWIDSSSPNSSRQNGRIVFRQPATVEI